MRWRKSGSGSDVDVDRPAGRIRRRVRPARKVPISIYGTLAGEPRDRRSPQAQVVRCPFASDDPRGMNEVLSCETGWPPQEFSVYRHAHRQSAGIMLFTLCQGAAPSSSRCLGAGMRVPSRLFCRKRRKNGREGVGGSHHPLTVARGTRRDYQLRLISYKNASSPASSVQPAFAERQFRVMVGLWRS